MVTLFLLTLNLSQVGTHTLARDLMHAGVFTVKINASEPVRLSQGDSHGIPSPISIL